MGRIVNPKSNAALRIPCQQNSGGISHNMGAESAKCMVRDSSSEINRFV